MSKAQTAPMGSQQGTAVSGRATVLGSGQPVANSHVRITGTSFVARTDADGRYSISPAPTGLFSIVARRDDLGSSEVTGVRLIKGQHVVVNLVFGSMQMQTGGLTTSASIVSIPFRDVSFANDPVMANNIPVPSQQSAVGSLEGKVAGLSVARVSGSPNAAVTIEARTPISFNGGSEPLYVVDGVMLSERFPVTAQDIQAMDVATIEVMKGVSATALYGFRALAGAIVITTNRGRDIENGAPQFSFRNEIGSDYTLGVIQSPAAHQFRVNSAGQYVDVNGNVVPRARRVIQANGIMENPYIDPVYDHNDQLFRPGLFNTQTAAVRQNLGPINYNADYSRSQQRGVVRNADGVVRQVARLNVDQHWRERLSVGFSASYTETSDEPAQAMFIALPRFNADVDLLAPDPTGFSRYVLTADPKESDLGNPLAEQLLTNDRIHRQRTLLNLNASFKPLPWLSIDANGGYDRGYQEEGVRVSFPQGTGVLESTERLTDSVAFGVFQGGATATKSFGALIAKLSVRAETQRDSYQSSDSSNSGIVIVGNADTLRNGSVRKSNVDRRTQAGLSEFAVQYNDKYFADFVFRREGMATFGTSHPWTTFQRASVAWDLKTEHWLPLGRLSEFKVHYSTGAGETPGSAYPIFALPIVQLPGSSPVPTQAPHIVAEREVGVQLGVGNRVSATVTRASMHSSEGELGDGTTANGNYYFYNIGLKGHTTEATLKLRVFQDFHGVRWDVAFVGDRKRSVVSQLDIGCRFLSDFRQLCNGVDLSAMQGYELARDKSTLPNVFANSLSAFDVNDDGYVVPVGPGNSWRDGKAKNLWGTVVNVAGQSFPWGLPIVQKDSAGITRFADLGNSSAAVPFGAQNTFRVRGFTLYGLFSGQLGGHMYNRLRQTLYRVGDDPAVNQIGKPDETRKPVAYYREVAQSVSVFNREFLESGTYARLSEASIGYRFDSNHFGFLRRIGARSLSVDFVGRNLFTLSNYSGQNPQSLSFRYSVDTFAYPLSRTFTLATNVVF